MTIRNVERIRRMIIEQERDRAPRPVSELEVEKARQCMWMAVDEFEVLPPEEPEEL